MALIFLLSSIPGDELPLPHFRFSDKLAHFLAFSVLGALIGWRDSLHVRLGGRAREARSGAWFPDTPGAITGILFGLSDELHQLFVPMRLFAWSDFAADALGVLAGLRIAQRLAGRRPRKE
jgi:VanZ family protein